MSETYLRPFEAVQRAAESLADERVKSQLLAELARQQLSAKQFDAALQTFAAIPSPQERRVALLVADFGNFPTEKIEPLVKLLEVDPLTDSLAGRLALAMLESGNNASGTASAWKLIGTATTAFEAEQQQYDFLEKVLPLTNDGDWEKIPRFFRTFPVGMHQVWASLAIVKHLAKRQRIDEAEPFIQTLSPLRRSWAYWEISQLIPAERSKHYFDKASEIIETMEISADDEETMETLAIQLRVFGRIAFQKDWKEQGLRLLERSEATAASLKVPMQRYRLQCFLGKVLVDLKQVGAIQDYIAINTMLESLPSASDRSRVLVWLAEAGWSEGWSKAVEVLAVPERGVTEPERAKQIADVLKRCVAHHQGRKATGDIAEDSIYLSGEEFENRYFSPFAEADCGCW